MSDTAAFPRNPDDFPEDDRISWVDARQDWALIDDKGGEWWWDNDKNRWFQPETQGETAAPNNGHVAAPIPDRKRKALTPAEGDTKKAKFQENRAIYITNLPDDTTLDELAEWAKQYGIVDEGIDGTKRIKMYANENGDFKGDALIVYLRKDSVDLAIRMGDDYWFRATNVDHHIHVKEADMSYKRHQAGQEVKFVRKDKKANEANRARLMGKLNDWSSDEEASTQTLQVRNKWDKHVVVKNAFTIHEVDEDPGVIADIKADMRGEAEKCGEVTNVVLFDREPEGILVVRFKEAEAAKKFVALSNGRNFGTAKPLEVFIAIDRPKFKKSGKGTASDEEEEAERLERFISDK